MTLDANGTKIVALFDTGAVTSILSRRAYDMLVKANCVGQSLSTGGIRLQTAGGNPLPLLGAFSVHFHALGMAMKGNFVVSENCVEQAIVGMNIIRDEYLMYDPWQERIVKGNANLASMAAHGVVAEIITDQEVRIHPMMAQRVRCMVRAKDPMYSIGPHFGFVGEVHGLPVCAVTDAEGKVDLYVSNMSMMDLDLPRRAVLGTAEDRRAYEGAPLTQDLASAVCRDMARATSGGPSQRGQPSQTKQRMIAEAVSRTVPAHMQKPYRDLLWSFGDIISEDALDLGFSDTVVHQIKLRDAEPVYTKQFPLPADEYDMIRLAVKDWVKIGIVEPAISNYNSPLFCVRKKEGQGLRVVLDYRKLNAKSLPDRYSIRGVDECIREVGHAHSRVFSALDLSSGFWQMKLDEKAREYTAFTVPGMGQFRWRTSPMGLAGCPASFSRLMDMVMRGLPNVITYIDDVLIHSPDVGSHWQHLQAALLRLRQHNLKLNLRKCVFAATRVPYLGHILTDQGIIPGADKTQALRETPLPRTVSEVRAFLGLANYFRGYIRNFARRAGPLYALTKKAADWTRSGMPAEAAEAFHLLKGLLLQAPVLAYPTREGQLHLYVDAATGKFDGTAPEGGLGAALLQTQADGTKRVLGYASRRLKDAEKNYSAFLLEMQAAVFGIDFFSMYLRGKRFILYSDHKPLERLNSTHQKTLSRLEEKMQEFTFEIRYVKGDDNGVADYLSRSAAAIANYPYHIFAASAGHGCAPVKVSETSTAKMQRADPSLRPYFRFLEGDMSLPPGQHLGPYLKDMRLKEGVLYYMMGKRKGFRNMNNYKIVAPAEMRPYLLKEAHDSVLGGHGGFFKTGERIKELYWWPQMEADVAEHVNKCVVCNQAQQKRPHTSAPLQPLQAPGKPNDRIHVDMFGPIKAADGSKKMICVMTDAFTKIVRLAVVQSKTAEEIARTIVTSWIAIYGVPKVIVTDQGKEFCNDFQRALWNSLGVDHKTTTPYHPQCDGQAEIFNKTMQHYLAKVILQAGESTVDWEKYITPLMISHNTAVHKATMTTPFYAMFGYDPRVPLWPDGQVLDFEHISDNPLVDLRRTQQLIRAQVHHNNQHYREGYKTAYDKRRGAAHSSFQVGDLVWCKVHASNDINKKFARSWEKGIIKHVKELEVYVVSRPDRSRHRLVTLGSADLRPREEGDPAPCEGTATDETTEETTEVVGPAEEEEGDSSASESEVDTDDSPDFRPPGVRRGTPTPGPMTRAKARQMATALRAARSIAAAVAPGESFAPEDLAELMQEVMTHDTGYFIYGMTGVPMAAGPQGPQLPAPAAAPQQPQPPPPPARKPMGTRQRKSYQERELARLRPFLNGPEDQESLPLGPRVTRGKRPNLAQEECHSKDAPATEESASTFARVKSFIWRDKVGGAEPQPRPSEQQTQHFNSLAAEMERRSNERRAEDARRLAEQGWRPSDPPPAWPLGVQQPGTPPFSQMEGRPLPEAKKKGKLSTWSKGARKLAFSPRSQF